MDDIQNIATSTPMIPSTSRSKFGTAGEKPIPKIPQGVVKNSQPVLEIVYEAVKVMGVPRKGASYQTIKKYVESKMSQAGKTCTSLSIKKAIVKGMERGRLLRPTMSKDSRGVTGHFILADEKVKDAPSKPRKPRVRKEQVSDSETIVKKSEREEKLNMSDSAIEYSKEKTKPSKKLAKAKIEKPLAKPVKLKAELGKNKAKLPKAVQEAPKAKTTKSKTEVKEKELSVKKKITKNKRKDASDSEVVVKKPNRKSLKSYSSDTEVDRTSKTDTVIKQKRTVQKKETKAAAKHKVTGGEPPAKMRSKKLFKVDEQDPSKTADTTTKVRKARIKKV